MSKKNKTAKVEDQKDVKTTPETQGTPAENTDPKTEESKKDEGEEKKFHFPKIPMPKLPSKEVVIGWLKKILLFVLGAIAGAAGIVVAANKIVQAKADDSEEETAEEETTEVETTIDPEPEAETPVEETETA